jgi:DNA-binding transcriptional LysR family regulator
MTRLVILSLVLAALVGCADYPKDVEGTSERLSGGTLHVGIVADGGAAADRPEQLIAALAQELSSRPEVETGNAEPMLLRLEKGELDLVVGSFAADTPWSTRVTFSKPLLPQTDPDHESKAAVRLGEHRWSMIVDGAVSRLNKQARP